MQKNLTGLAILLIVVATIVGFTASYLLAPTKVVTTDKVCQPVVCAPCETCPVIPEKVTEVAVPLNAKETYLNAAIEQFKKDKLEDLTECDSEEYDEDQITIRTIGDDWALEYGEDAYSVAFNVELKYLDKDTEVKCYNDFDVKVTYDTSKYPEDPIVEIL